MPEAKNERAVLNTTINKDILSNFRDYCRDINCPMNMVIETFMEQFTEGCFVLKLCKNKKRELDIED